MKSVDIYGPQSQTAIRIKPVSTAIPKRKKRASKSMVYKKIEQGSKLTKTVIAAHSSATHEVIPSKELCEASGIPADFFVESIELPTDPSAPEATIDFIFGEAKKEKALQSEKEARTRAAEREFAPQAQLPRAIRVEDGLQIFTPDQLNIGQGKNTPNCPFDCDCCF